MLFARGLLNLWMFHAADMGLVDNVTVSFLLGRRPVDDLKAML